MRLSICGIRYSLSITLLFLISTSLAAQDARIAELTKKAESGDASAQYQLGLAHATGRGFEYSSFVDAISWYRKAAEQGLADAQSALAVEYTLGRAVPKDNAEAIRWYEKAAAQGDCVAQAIIDREAAKNHRGTAELIKQAENGNVEAQYNLGIAYATGEDGIFRNGAQAVHWLRLAAEKEWASAEKALGEKYRDGDGVPKDTAEGSRWLRRATEQGYADAKLVLGENFASCLSYCKLWATDRKHYSSFTPVPSSGHTDPFGLTDYCPSYLVNWGSSDGNVTEQEVQAARQEVKEDEERVAKSNYLTANRCRSSDPRTSEEREQDPICIQQKLDEAQARASVMSTEQIRESNEQLLLRRKAAISTLGLHHGQSQATVKSILQRDGFRMPWVCGGYWVDGTWYSACIARRGSDSVWVKFSVYSRIRYVNPDTQVSTIVNKNSDKLALIRYGDGRYVWGEDGEGLPWGFTELEGP